MTTDGPSNTTRDDDRQRPGGGTGGSDPRHVDVENGNAVVPDADEAADSEDLKPEAPPEGAPAEGDPAKKSAVAPPVPAHGEMASQEQIREAARAAEEEDAEA